MTDKSNIRYANLIIISLIKSSNVLINDKNGNTAYDYYENVEKIEK